MSRTGVDSLDRSIDKTNAWLADIAASIGTDDRRMAYRVTRSWLHTLRDRMPVQVAAHVAAQLPELLRGVFYEGWNPGRLPVKFGRDEYLARFARDAQIHLSEVPEAGRQVTSAMRRHLSAGAIREALGVLPGEIRNLLAPPDGGQAAPAPAPARAGTSKAAAGRTARRTATAAGTRTARETAKGTTKGTAKGTAKGGATGTARAAGARRAASTPRSGTAGQRAGTARPAKGGTK